MLEFLSKYLPAPAHSFFLMCGDLLHMQGSYFSNYGERGKQGKGVSSSQIPPQQRLFQFTPVSNWNISIDHKYIWQ